MSTEVVALFLVVALILAGYQVRKAFREWFMGRRRDAVVVTGSMLVMAGLGVLLAGWVFGWKAWPGGLVVGLAASSPLAERWARRRLGESEKPGGPA